MHEKLTYVINGGLFAVQNQIGSIWPEEAYEAALELELNKRKLRVERQREFEVPYFDKRVGTYRIDLLVNDLVIIELKAVPSLQPIHRAQLLSYLKGYRKPLGILANFGSASVEHETMPNARLTDPPLTDRFDCDALTLPGKARIKDLLFMANRVLLTLGPGYLPQIYRRAMFYELQTARAEFETIKKMTAQYDNQPVGEQDVNFFRVGDVLISIDTVRNLDDDLLLLKFRQYITHLHCQHGVIFNFRSTVLDFRYLE